MQALHPKPGAKERFKLVCEASLAILCLLVWTALVVLASFNPTVGIPLCVVFAFLAVSGYIYYG